MTMVAAISSTALKDYCVVFYYVDERGRANYQFPEIRIPVKSYEHAKAMVAVFMYNN